jgi:bifunctional pyridoxal-dependent enzyme with beta-cystathionase and maltose regulon repressor activities
LFISCQIVWFKEFKTFKEKPSAIRHDTGVDRKLSNMIMKWHDPQKMLVVGKPEYKTIIEMTMVSVLLVCFYVCRL